MGKITILNPHKDPFEVEVIRYFVMGDSEILLYTLNEMDSENNVRLYVTKVNNGITSDLTDQEWTYVKATIRNIVNENREAKELSVNDLDYKKLSGLVVEHLKVFKLAGDVLPDLKANQKEYEDQKKTEVLNDTEHLFEDITKNTTVNEGPNLSNSDQQRHEDRQVLPATNPAIDYKKMYEDIAQEKKKLEEELFDLQSKTVSYQIKYDQIRQILSGGSLPKDYEKSGDK